MYCVFFSPIPCVIKQLDCVTKDEGKKLNAVRENVSVLRAKRWSQFFRFSVREVISSLRETFNVQSIRTVYVYLIVSSMQYIYAYINTSVDVYAKNINQ